MTGSPSDPYRSPREQDDSPGDVVPVVPAEFIPSKPGRWTKELNRYHWFVLIVAALGWLFDTMDQQLFNLARVPAMKELLAPEPGVAADQKDVDFYGGVATSIFLIGWASGGLLFGVLGDRIGRAKTMIWTILVYSLCTGLSALSVGFWDFAAYRFLTGLGVGGEFAVGVALVAEVMPDRARPFALGLLQALSAVGNISAAGISIFFGHLEQTGVLGEWHVFGVQITAWRAMFVVGTLPALLALLIRRRLKEPERWQAAAHDDAISKQLGSYKELFGDARWRKRALVGLVLAVSGVIGVWGIVFFCFDLGRSVFRTQFEQEARVAGEAASDREFLKAVVADPDALANVKQEIKPAELLNLEEGKNDAQSIWAAVLELRKNKQPISVESVLAQADRQDRADGKLDERSQREAANRRREYLAGESTTSEPESPAAADAAIQAHAQRIADRTTEISGRLTWWIGIMSLTLNIGAFFGIYAFSMLTHRVGRRWAFAISFVSAGISTALTFWFLRQTSDVFWMIPIMGFCMLSVFGGYAIYFPELFPTRLRSTGTSFCYNVGRYIAALGPFTLGFLASDVFGHLTEPGAPLRYAGVTMCSVFVISLLALPFAPETKGQPLPE